MKTSLFCCIFFLFSCSVFSQETTPTYQHQFGFDAGNFLARFLNFSGSGNSNQLYQATYRKLGSNKNTRIGLEFILSVESGSGNGTATNNSINFRVGKERFKDFGNFRKNNAELRAWRAFYGWDFKFQFSYTGLGFDGSSTSVQVGLGPSHRQSCLMTFWLMFEMSMRPPDMVFSPYSIHQLLFLSTMIFKLLQ